MNLYFKNRFQCSSAQIGPVVQASRRCARRSRRCARPAVARRFGKLRSAVGSELLSLPFLVTLGAEQRLGVAVVAFWLRASFMQASTAAAPGVHHGGAAARAARARHEPHEHVVEHRLGGERDARRAR
jgi:hypothetical protein